MRWTVQVARMFARGSVDQLSSAGNKMDVSMFLSWGHGYPKLTILRGKCPPYIRLAIDDNLRKADRLIDRIWEMLLDTRILNKLIYQLTLSGTVPPNWLASLSLTV
ncbi:hypothetical protein ABVK25_007486 [Lepraria finkii]|uniref:Uncharacterized protein n=1 Tax=Lepraria finkii TaxID=1340010 RepID=A0ABR4B338_9LECA